MELKNRWVNFRIRDVYYPDAIQVFDELHGDDLLQGKVIDISESGTQEGTFAVVQVEGMKQPVVVAVTQILGVL
jgi:hypothetical protein